MYVAVVVMLMLCVIVLATPFEDAGLHFSVDVPEGWVYAPVPGHSDGGSFVKVVDYLSAVAGIRVFGVSDGTTLESLAQDLQAERLDDPEYRVLASKYVRLGGQPALRRIFVASSPHDSRRSSTRMVEEWVTVRDGYGYVVRTETVAEVFGSFEEDFSRFFSTFAFGPGVTAGAS